MRRLDLVGHKYGRLKVIEFAYANKHSFWSCRCDCQNIVIVASDKLRLGKTRSCGCLSKEIHSKHGHCRRQKISTIYMLWRQMINRCRYSNNKNYKDYGGRGIKVCDRWQDDHGFENFLADMGERLEGMTIERIDNNKGYSPENCKWGSRKEQNNNKRTNVKIWDDGKFVTMSQFARNHNIAYNKLKKRIYYWRQRNLTIDEIIQKYFYGGVSSGYLHQF